MFLYNKLENKIINIEIVIVYGGKQWQTTPKNLPRTQHTRVIPVA
jgi:UDP-galactopyranose mutase